MHKSLQAVAVDWPVLPSLRLRSTPDRYGFSYWVSRKLGLKYTPRSFCNWLHGWIWWDPTSPEEFGFHREHSYIPKVVSNQRLARILASYGVNNIFSAGLPYAYVAHNAVPPAYSTLGRQPGSLLLIPDHSSESNLVSHNIGEYLDFADSLRASFSNISILVYHLDYNTLAPLIRERGFSPLIGASPRCPNSMSRVKSYMDCHQYVSTNFIGSHFLYALSSGCKVSISGPYQARDESIHADDVVAGLYSWEFVQKMIYVSSFEYIKSHDFLSRYVVDSPLFSPVLDEQARQFVFDEMGFHELLPCRDLIPLLGWNLTAQVKGYAKGGARRVARLFQSSGQTSSA